MGATSQIFALETKSQMLNCNQRATFLCKTGNPMMFSPRAATSSRSDIDHNVGGAVGAVKAQRAALTVGPLLEVGDTTRAHKHISLS